MIKENKFDSLTAIHNKYKVNNSYPKKNVSPETTVNRSEKIKDTVEISTSVDVNNETRIKEIKEQIQNNQYKIYTDRIAKAIMSDLSLLK